MWSNIASEKPRLHFPPEEFVCQLADTSGTESVAGNGQLIFAWLDGTVGAEFIAKVTAALQKVDINLSHTPYVLL